jgi:diguanylate cyclase (GGDEF)-like protein
MVRLNFFLALGYFLGGFLGNLIAIPPSHASAIWPAAGIALAGIVTYGRSVIPGIWLGAFITQVYTFSDFSNLQNMPDSLAIGGIVSMAATVQAVLGAWLIKRNIGANNPLIDDGSILRFFALGGPLSCMVSASIGIATLYLEGVNNLENSAYSWVTWWIGDVIGVLIFTPLLLCFIGKPRSHWRQRINPVALPLLMLSLLVAALFQLGKSQEQARISAIFEERTNLLHNALQNELNRHIEINQTLTIGNEVDEVKRHFDNLQVLIKITDGSVELFDETADPSILKRGFPALEKTAQLRLADRTWNISYRPAPQFYHAQISWNIWWLILGGFFLAGLTGLGLLMLTGRTMQTEGIVKTRTRELEKEIARRKQIIQQHHDHNKVLQAIASPVPLSDILELIVITAEQNFPDSLCSIQLLDEEGKHLYSGAAPSLPEFYKQALDGIAIGDGIGSCGTAAYKGQRVIIEDVCQHPHWQDFAALAKQAGLAACWSEPVFSSTQRVLGTFSVYHRTPNYPDSELLTEINELAQLASIAIERKFSEEKVTHLAFFDALTNLPNRRLFMSNLEKALASDIRHKTNGALLYLDLDHFKTLNDSLGHDIGDELLIEVANRLKQCVRDEDTVARLGGDEFVLLLSCREISLDAMIEHALTTAERVRIALQAPYQLKEHVHYITPSIGISLMPYPNVTAGELLKQADTAMYHAKSRGRNAISFYSEDMQRLANQRLMLENDLRLALAQQQFSLHYQPQFDGANQLIGAEALLRWQHPEKGMIPLADFIHVAEETGLILLIGDWVVREACTQLLKWPDLPHLAINISHKQFRQPKFHQKIAAILAEFEMVKPRLTLEITEGSLIEDIDATIEKLQALQSMGIGISIDDFGTGYSSLAYLRRFPLNQLKIDQSFIHDINSDANDSVIVETIIGMAKHLGLSVIAEGVETSEQVQFLRDNNCKGYQGYLFSIPLAADEFTRQFINVCPIDD